MYHVWAKMAKYHIFWKFLAKKHCFGNKWQSTTFFRTQVSETRVPHQLCHCGTFSKTQVSETRVPHQLCGTRAW